MYLLPEIRPPHHCLKASFRDCCFPLEVLLELTILGVLVHAFPTVPSLLIVPSADLSVHLSVYLYGTSFLLGIGVVTVCPLFPSPLAVTSTQIFNSSQKNHNFFWKNEKFWQSSHMALLQQN